MRLFTRNKAVAVQTLILKIVNNNCSDIDALMEGPRGEGRVNLTVVVQMVPVVEKRPNIDRAFAAVTKEFSTSGVSIVLSEPKGLDEVIVGFRWEGETTWVRAKAKHLSPMGGGFFQIGLRLVEVIYAGDYPQLGALVW